MGTRLSGAGFPWRDQDIRWLCKRNADGKLVVRVQHLNLGPINEAEITSRRIAETLQSDRYGMDREDRKYVVWLDLPDDVEFRCGEIATDGCASGWFNDDRPGKENFNNSRPAWPMVVFRGQGALRRRFVIYHELMHTLGGTIEGAPGVTPNDPTVPDGQEDFSHTYEIQDFLWTPTSPPDCGEFKVTDCGRNTYYSTLCLVNESVCPGPGRDFGPSEWLANHWNIANSDFLTYPDPLFVGFPTCLSARPTWNGEEYSETVTFNPTNDVVAGFEGYDELHGQEGDDRLCGQNGADTLYGDGGMDVLSGGWGDDSLEGGAGADTLRGGEQDDALGGGDGNDALYDGRGSDTIVGGPGTDTLYRCDDSNLIAPDVEQVMAPSESYC